VGTKGRGGRKPQAVVRPGLRSVTRGRIIDEPNRVGVSKASVNRPLVPSRCRHSQLSPSSDAPSPRLSPPAGFRASSPGGSVIGASCPRPAHNPPEALRGGVPVSVTRSGLVNRVRYCTSSTPLSPILIASVAPSDAPSVAMFPLHGPEFQFKIGWRRSKTPLRATSWVVESPLPH
jgi:hypothetical protein